MRERPYDYGRSLSRACPMSVKILVVDDDLTLTKTIEQSLNSVGYQVLLAYTAEDGVRLALMEQPSLVLLDVMIPNMGGWEACRQIRAVSQVPIIFLTALWHTDNIVYGLEVGADDYIVKPFREPELLARIMAHLRRVSAASLPASRLVFGNEELVIDLQAHLVKVNGQVVDLTPREYDLLVSLAIHAGRVIPAKELVEMAWGMTDDMATDNLKPYIHYLRRKLEADPAAPRWILAVRGVGYRFSEF